MSLNKESFMKKAFCLLLAILLAAPLWTLPGTAAGEKPVITAPADGNVLAAGDVTIHWTAVSGADYYTVNIRYIENGENGPLAANAVPVDGTSYTLPEETTAALGNGAYRICVASVHGTEVRYSDTVTFRLADGNEPLLGKKAVFFGDSLTASFGWCRQLALRFGLEAVNAGVGGETSEMARARFEADVLAQSPDYVFICFGMNDQVHADHRNPRVSVERFAENITYFVTEAQRADAEVILITWKSQAIIPTRSIRKATTRLTAGSMPISTVTAPRCAKSPPHMEQGLSTYSRNSGAGTLPCCSSRQASIRFRQATTSMQTAQALIYRRGM